MPIKSISKVYRPVRVGKVHLGIKVKTTIPCKCKNRTDNKKPMPNCTVCKGTGFIFIPKEVDYFVLRDAPELIEFYPPEPKELRISFPSIRFELGGNLEETLDRYLEKIFPQYLKRYSRSGLLCKGNEEKATKINEEGCLEETGCPCEYLEKGECKRDAIFRFRDRNLVSFNVFQVRTSSSNSIKNINSGVRDLVEHCAINKIDPSHVKLLLRRMPQSVSRLANGGPKTSTHHIMQIDLDYRFYESLEQVREAAVRLLAPDPEKLLPPADESRDDLYFPEKEVAKAQEEVQAEEEEKETPGKEETENDPGKKIEYHGFIPLTDDDIKHYSADDLKASLLDMTAHFVKGGGVISKGASEKILKATKMEEIINPYLYYRERLKKLEE